MAFLFQHDLKAHICFINFPGRINVVNSCIHPHMLWVLIRLEQSSGKLLKYYWTAVSETEIFSRTEGKSTGQRNFGFI